LTTSSNLGALAIAIGAVAFAMLAPAAQAAGPDTAWTGSIVEEDDFWAPNNKDRHYTHGIRFSATTGDLRDPAWQEPFAWIARLTPAFTSDVDGTNTAGEQTVERYNLVPLGQNMYTPENPALVNPDPRDRPYAGWLYGGVGLVQDIPGRRAEGDGFAGTDRFEELALKLGIVGPGSLANTTQTHYHVLIDVAPFRGWHAQLHNEPAVDLYYERKWRLYRETAGGWGWDAIPQAGLRVGNVYDYLSAGGMVRLGRNLRVDYGPPHIDQNLGADYLNDGRITAGDFGFYLFTGVEARAVARNIFLDGNSFKSSASVEKIPAVGDLEAGAALFWRHYRLSYTWVYRTPEFIHQDGPDHYGSLSLSFRLPF
jgi:hypothetical protein